MPAPRGSRRSRLAAAGRISRERASRSTRRGRGYGFLAVYQYAGAIRHVPRFRHRARARGERRASHRFQADPATDRLRVTFGIYNGWGELPAARSSSSTSRFVPPCITTERGRPRWPRGAGVRIGSSMPTFRSSGPPESRRARGKRSSRVEHPRVAGAGPQTRSCGRETRAGSRSSTRSTASASCAAPPRRSS